MSTHIQTKAGSLILAALLAAGAGCMIHRPDEAVNPAVPVAATFHEQPSATQDSRSETISPWWHSFQDSELNELMERALENNLTLHQLVARLEQAQALSRQAQGRLFPTLDVGAEYESRWIDDLSEDRRFQNRVESTSLGGMLQWEIDVWGKLRSVKKARAFEVEAARDTWQGGRLLLSALLTETFFRILEQRQQRDLLREQIRINTTLLDLTKLRFGQGQSSIVDVLQQREQLVATHSLIPDVESRLGELEYLLDVLVGGAPGTRARVQSSSLHSLPPIPPAGLPSDLLENRPDVRAARHQVIALDYRVGEAIADRLPQFVLGGSLLLSGDPGFSDMITSAFAAVAGPLFDAGTRRAEVTFRQAQLREALAVFAQTYLVAIQEVEIALLRERKEAERLLILEDELRNAESLLSETRHRYSQGLTDYLPVLTAVVRKQNLERDLITGRRELLSSRVALHRSIGGTMSEATRDLSMAARRTPRS